MVSLSDVATVTCGTAHGLQTGMYVNVTGSTTNYVNGIYKITRTGANTFTYDKIQVHQMELPVR